MQKPKGKLKALVKGALSPLKIGSKADRQLKKDTKDYNKSIDKEFSRGGAFKKKK
jgi:hypothetical protein